MERRLWKIDRSVGVALTDKRCSVSGSRSWQSVHRYRQANSSANWRREVKKVLMGRPLFREYQGKFQHSNRRAHVVNASARRCEPLATVALTSCRFQAAIFGHLKSFGNSSRFDSGSTKRLHSSPFSWPLTVIVLRVFVLPVLSRNVSRHPYSCPQSSFKLFSSNWKWILVVNIAILVIVACKKLGHGAMQSKIVPIHNMHSSVGKCGLLISSLRYCYNYQLNKVKWTWESKGGVPS